MLAFHLSPSCRMRTKCADGGGSAGSWMFILSQYRFAQRSGEMALNERFSIELPFNRLAEPDGQTDGLEAAAHIFERPPMSQMGHDLQNSHST